VSGAVVRMPVPTWSNPGSTRRYLSVDKMIQFIDEYRSHPEAAGYPVELIVDDVEAVPLLPGPDPHAWADEPEHVPDVPRWWVVLVRTARGQVRVSGSPWVVGGWDRLLKAAEAQA